MAASSTMIVSQVTAPAQLASSCSSLRCSKLVGAASPSLATFRPRTSHAVRCQAGNDGGVGGLREAVDRASKKTITEEQILRNQETNESEKKPVFGSDQLIPSVTSDGFYPRPEVERRPETGDKSFTGLFAFDGAAPETINGRLAMLGMVWAFVAEKTNGLTVFEQLYTPGQTGLVFFVGAVQLFTYASLVPILNGESTDARSFGPFTARAERWNGRLAMLGFLSLVVTEMIRHAPVFH